MILFIRFQPLQSCILYHLAILVKSLDYLDYSHDERFSRARGSFVDTDHLTSDGSAAFMQIFFQDLKQYYPD